MTDVYVMFKDGKNKDAARAFTEFLMDPDAEPPIRQGPRIPADLHVAVRAARLPGGTRPRPSPTRSRVRSSSRWYAAWVEFDKIGTNAVTAMFLDGTGPDKACQAMIDGLAGIEQ